MECLCRKEWREDTNTNRNRSGRFKWIWPFKYGMNTIYIMWIENKLCWVMEQRWVDTRISMCRRFPFACGNSLKGSSRDIGDKADLWPGDTATLAAVQLYARYTRNCVGLFSQVKSKQAAEHLCGNELWTLPATRIFVIRDIASGERCISMWFKLIYMIRWIMLQYFSTYIPYNIIFYLIDEAEHVNQNDGLFVR